MEKDNILTSFRTKGGHDVQLVKLEEKYFEETIKMMVKTQLKSHPWFINAELDSENWKEFLKCFFTKEVALAEGSYHVVALADGKVAGFAGLKDQSSPYPSFPHIKLGETWNCQSRAYTRYSKLDEIARILYFCSGSRWMIFIQEMELGNSCFHLTNT